MDFPFEIKVDPEIADEVHRKAEEIRFIGTKIIAFIRKRELKNADLWALLNTQDDIDISTYRYTYDNENNILTCEGLEQEDNENEAI